jgi:hypothetical protein
MSTKGFTEMQSPKGGPQGFPTRGSHTRPPPSGIRQGGEPKDGATKVPQGGTTGEFLQVGVPELGSPRLVDRWGFKERGQTRGSPKVFQPVGSPKGDHRRVLRQRRFPNRLRQARSEKRYPARGLPQAASPKGVTKWGSPKGSHRRRAPQAGRHKGLPLSVVPTWGYPKEDPTMVDTQG